MRLNVLFFLLCSYLTRPAIFATAIRKSTTQKPSMNESFLVKVKFDNVQRFLTESFLKFIPLLLFYIHDMMILYVIFKVYIVILYWISSAMCEPGSYSPSGLNDPQAPCRTCEKGFYQSKPGQTQCIPCYSKYTTSQRGSPTASECKGMFWTVLPLLRIKIPTCEFAK